MFMLLLSLKYNATTSVAGYTSSSSSSSFPYLLVRGNRGVLQFSVGCAFGRPSLESSSGNADRVQIASREIGPPVAAVCSRRLVTNKLHGK